jgi:hypothetical protein
MKKISEAVLLEYVGEVGEFEKEHRKYSSFYCNLNHTITQADVDELATDGIDASAFLNVCIERHGTWDDSCGTEWDDTTYTLTEPYEELVPEVVIPAHTVTKYRTKPFTPEFE